MSVAVPRLVGSILRAAEVVCGSVVLVLISLFLRDNRASALNEFQTSVFLTLAISAASVIVALMILPAANLFFRYFILDFALGAIWFAAFGMLLVSFHKTACTQGLGSLGAIVTGGSCNSQRATWGFAFLSGCCWLCTAFVGFWVLKKEKQARKKAGPTTANRPV